MTERNPTRAALLELQDEHRAMQEGWVFLDEKCLLLAGEMMRQLQTLDAWQAKLDAAQQAATDALQAAMGRHGLQGLQLQPAAPQAKACTELHTGSIMGVKLLEARWIADSEPAPAAAAASPEARDARQATVALIAAAAPVAAVYGNLERLSQEYRRSVRRARALQDVLLPEANRDLADIAGRIEELDQQDAITMRHGVAR